VSFRSSERSIGSAISNETSTPHSFNSSSFQSSETVSSSHVILAFAEALSARAISRPSLLSRSTSIRLTATISSPFVSTIVTFSRPIEPAFSTVLFPAIIRLFLSSKIDRPAPCLRNDFSIKELPNSFPLL